MKKLLSVLLSMAMAVSMTACGGADEEETGKVKIGVLQQLEHVALDQSREGFIDALKDNGYTDENVEWDIQNAQNDVSNLQTMAERLVNDKNDLILAIATGSAQTLAGKTTEIPIMVTSVTDPVDAGLVNSWEKPGTNVSGTSDLSPMAEQIDLLLKLDPEVRTIGLLYTSSEDNSILQIEQMKNILDEKGIKYVENTVTNSNDVQQAVQSIVEKCDAIYIPTDNVLASAMALVADVALKEKVPVVAGDIGMTMIGGLATVGIDYYNLGYITGEMAVRVLNGEDISEMPIETQKDYRISINATAVEALGIEVPEDLVQYVK